jgi:hypothetical protein
MFWCKTNTFTNFDAPDAHFDYANLFSDARSKKLEIGKKKEKTERTVG